MEIAVVILAAGQGSRMQSALPKVLQPIAGQPMLKHIMQTVYQTLKAQSVFDTSTIHVIVNQQADLIREMFKKDPINWVTQLKQKGTGDAIKQVLPFCKEADAILIVYGDIPLITWQTLLNLLEVSAGKQLTLLTAKLPNPEGYGRVVRDDQNNIIQIVEEKDASLIEKKNNEINTGMMIAPCKLLAHWTDQLTPNNIQNEYYLTDIVKIAASENHAILDQITHNLLEISGVNTRQQQINLERAYQKMQCDQLIQQGVTVLDPNRLDIRGILSVGQDVTIDINCIFEGTVSLGNQVIIGAGCIIRDSHIEDYTHIKPYSVINQSHISSHCQVGPFSRLRPNTHLSEGVCIGNFVEIKQSHVSNHTKIKHLSYIGDSDIGQHVNIGAGTITCNYDGMNKHKTIIKNNAFIGANTSLIAPVTIEEKATIGAGSTITETAEAGCLTLSRSTQRKVLKWSRNKKPKS